MYDTSGDLNGCHRVISLVKGRALDMKVQLGFWAYRGLSVPILSQPLLKAIGGPEIGFETDRQ